MNVKKTIGTIIGVSIAGYGLFKMLSDGEIPKYSSKWFESASDEVLKIEREVVRQQYCSAGNDYRLAIISEKLLKLFDSVLSKRAWNGHTDYGYPVHREHGWYLSNDD
ncbi:hypothetical protein [Clostridium butyricum]|uniref:hypothetical protein n=1 Tax=Clostridium butyricum TaxID=1492 RepID=UPI0013D78261|nr:hypothetical protein [Clostridium butyricum]MCQ2017136.1 hypothetical protein [Clostridium butyricum]MCQ2023241.1 hypothetical protein [Clostridium butyricum]NFB73313.1 hypothetical protein [Clostridium butyricum]NFB92797.1 hypothetical protein [Clostridium butyricum]UTY53731.1 hypothetical protein HNS01_11730 [Clostridium butyricum]